GLRQSVPGKLQGVGCHPRFQRPQYFRRRSKESVRRNKVVDASVRPLEVVMVDEQTDAPLGVAKIDKDRRLDALAPQGSPEPLNLSQRLRMPGRGDHLPDAALLQLPAEGTLPPQGDVLTAVVCQNLLWRSVRHQSRSKHFQDQSGRLAGVQSISDEKTA